jgi:hypothetical protein
VVASVAGWKLKRTRSKLVDSGLSRIDNLLQLLTQNGDAKMSYNKKAILERSLWGMETFLLTIMREVPEETWTKAMLADVQVRIEELEKSGTTATMEIAV